MTATGAIPADSVRRPRHHESFPLRNKSCVVLEYLSVYQYSSNPPDTLTSFARFRIRCSNNECFIARVSNPKGAHIPSRRNRYYSNKTEASSSRTRMSSDMQIEKWEKPDMQATRSVTLLWALAHYTTWAS